MSGKGSGRRPTQVDAATFQSNWDRIFSVTPKDKPLLAFEEASDAPLVLLGTSSTGRASGSNPDSVGSTPTSPANMAPGGDGCICHMDGACCCPRAVYVDDATGK